MAEQGDNGSGRIVVGVDGSDASKDALRWAAHQAELTGAALEVVMTWHIPAAAYGMAVPAPVPTDYDFGTETSKILDTAIADALGDHQIAVSTVIMEGHPAPSLLAKAAGADLLVLGSRGHGAFAGMLLGSVSEHCVSHAPCPVVVVRHNPDPVK